MQQPGPPPPGGYNPNVRPGMQQPTPGIMGPPPPLNSGPPKPNQVHGMGPPGPPISANPGAMHGPPSAMSGPPKAGQFQGSVPSGPSTSVNSGGMYGQRPSMTLAGQPQYGGHATGNLPQGNNIQRTWQQ